MAIVQVVFPDVSPVAGLIANTYQAQNNQLAELVRGIGMVDPVNGSNIIQGAVLNVGGILYKVDADTAITGTASKYVKITPSVDTLTCTASFVANLTGVSWNKVANGYYDVSGNLYLFDEALAINDGDLSLVYSKIGKIKTLSNVTVKNISGMNRVHGMLSLTGSGSWICPDGVNNIFVRIGAGGASGACFSISGNNGNDTTFNGKTAHKGIKGLNAQSSGGTGGSGGSGAALSGEKSFTGGNGGNNSSGSGAAGVAVTALGSIKNDLGSGGDGGLGQAGGGGGAGEMLCFYMAVIPGNSYSYSVGSGGAQVGPDSQPTTGFAGKNGSIWIEY
jgi:hypothetical protein